MTIATIGMDLETLKHVQQTAVQAAGVDVKNRVCVRDGLPDKTKWMLIDKDGKSELHDVSQPPRQHRLLSVQEVVAFARLARTETGFNSQPIVWIGSERIIVTLDDRRLFGDRAIYEFRPTEEWELVNKLAESVEGLIQSKFLRLLRVELAESFGNDDVRRDLIQRLRKVRAQQQSNIGNGSGSYEASLTSGSEEAILWPDNVDLSIRVFDDPALKNRSLIRCAFEVEPQPPRFQLSPLTAHVANALNEALELASETIRAELKSDSGIPVFLGQPE